jgi:hypothetical protein
MLDCIHDFFLNPLSEQFDYLSASVIEYSELLTSAPHLVVVQMHTMRPFLPSLLRPEDPAHFTHFAHLQSSRGGGRDGGKRKKLLISLTLLLIRPSPSSRGGLQ